MRNFIEIENVQVVYPIPNGNFIAINDLSISVLEKSFISITGRSGSGKSTLLKIIGGILRPTSGKVIIEGNDIYSYSDVYLAEYRMKKIGFIFQDYFLEELYTVYQNIEIALMISGFPPNMRLERIEKVLEEVGLTGKENIQVLNLSGGEKQRVGIARAIANSPDIILADEPCGNLDYENGKRVMQLLREESDKGKTVILITHNIEDAKETDRIITLEDGRVIKDEKS
jgi:ABC-type lipoprotein export system ATPase subunit